MVVKINVHNNNIQSLRNTVECLEKEQNCYQNEVEKYITILQLQKKKKQIVGEDPAEDLAIDTNIVVGSSFDVHDAITSKKSLVLNNDDTNLRFSLMDSAQSLLRIQKMLSIQQNKLSTHEREQYEKEKAEMQLTINALRKEKDQLLLARKKKQEEQLHDDVPCNQISTDCSINSKSFEALKRENNQLHMTLNVLKRERNIIQYYIKDAYAYEECQWKQQTERHNSMSNEQEGNDRSDNVDQQQLQVALKAITQEKDRYQQQYQQMKAQYQDLLRRQRISNKKRDEVKEHEKQAIAISPPTQRRENATTVQKEEQEQEQQQQAQQKKDHFNHDGNNNNNNEGHNSNSKNMEEEETVNLDEGWLLGDGNQEILIMDSCDRHIGCFEGGYSTTNIEMVVQLTNKS